MMKVTLPFSEQPQLSMNVLQNNDYTPLLSKAYFDTILVEMVICDCELMINFNFCGFYQICMFPYGCRIYNI